MSDSHQDVYSKHLLRSGYGYPLRTPEPMSTLPPKYQDHGLQIGDVGIVDDDGQFDVLFNICRREDNPIQSHGVPKNFQPVLPDAIKTVESAISAGPIRSLGIREILRHNEQGYFSM